MLGAAKVLVGQAALGVEARVQVASAADMAVHRSKAGPARAVSPRFTAALHRG